MKSYLTKNDFSRWMTCPTAAHYGWTCKVSKNENDAFLQFLAEEGQTVGRMARRLFAGAKYVEEANLEYADQITRKHLGNDKVTLFEGCIIHDNFVIRPDVLIRKGSTLYIIEVKSKVGNMSQHREGKMLINCYADVRAAYREIVYDLAFQVEVLQRALPEFEVVPYFLLPEESSLGQEEEVEAARQKETIYATDEAEDIIPSRRSESVLKFFPTASAIRKVGPIVTATVDVMNAAWKDSERPQPQLKYQCRNCEFRLNNGKQKDDGFHHCWGKLAHPEPHIFSLYQLYSLKQAENKQALLADAKIDAAKTSLYDISESELHGEHSARQRIQLQYQQSSEEFIDPKLGEKIADLQWPIAFVDFETVMSAIPPYPGLRPYQVLPFQFSAHILHEDGRMVHREWLNTVDRIPTLPFIQHLKAALEGVNSVLVFTDYENRILNESFDFLRRYGEDVREERAWIYELLNSGRIIDQHQWVYDHYFHPEMTGRTSIKVVLPAVWRNNAELHRHTYFERYFKETDNEILDPYKTLPELSINGAPIVVREGCGAMQAYREMIQGRGAHCMDTRDKLAEMLRNYVTLDTASQWIIFEHWRQRLRDL